MKRRYFPELAFFLILFLSGCASVQMEVAKFDDQNALNTVSSAKQIMKHWGMNSAVIREILGSSINEKFPASFLDAMNRLDRFEKKYGKDQAGMTEPDAGTIVILTLKLVEPTIQSIWKQYAPDVWSDILKYIPFFLQI